MRANPAIACDVSRRRRPGDDGRHELTAQARPLADRHHRRRASAGSPPRWRCASAASTSQVYERSSKLDEVGAGLQVGPNARQGACARLGSRTSCAATPSSRPTWSRSNGTTPACAIARRSRRSRPQEYGAPYMTAHRADIQAMLHDALPDGVITLDATCVGADRRAARRAVARFADGSEVEGDAVIGADGIRSAIRAQHFGADRPRFTEMMCWRCMVPMEHGADAVRTERLGRARARRIFRLARAERPRDLLPDRRGRRCSTCSPATSPISGSRNRGRCRARSDELIEAYAGWNEALLGMFRHVAARLQMGHLRPRPGAGMDPRPRDAARRRRASDHADAGAGRQHGDRGRLCAGAQSRAPRR